MPWLFSSARVRQNRGCSQESFRLSFVALKSTFNGFLRFDPNRILLTIVVLPTLFGVSALAQSDPMQPDLRPFAPGDSSNVDTVSIVNGGVQLRIPLYSVPQRGAAKLDIWLSYVNPNFDETTDCSLHSQEPTYPCYQMWESSNQQVVAKNSTQVTMTEIDAISSDSGTLYSNGYYWLLTTADGGPHKMAMVSTGVYRSIDGTGWLYSEPTCTATDSSGTSYVYACTQLDNSSGVYNNRAKTAAGRLLYVQDSNQNRIALNYTSYQQSGVTFYTFTGWSDTYGRSIGVPVAASAGACSSSNSFNTTWSIPGVQNAFTFCYSTVAILTNFWNGIGWPTNTKIPQNKNSKWEYAATENYLSQVILPSGLSWQFQYTSGSTINYGELTQITTPTGGTIQYVWGRNDHSCGFGTSPQNVSRGTLTTRTVNDSSGAHVWTYSGFPGPQPTQETATTVKVVDPLMNVTLHTLSPIYQCSLYETSTAYYDNASNPIETTTTTFQPLSNLDVISTNTIHDPPVGAALPKSITTVWHNGQTSSKVNTYDSGFVATGYDTTVQTVPYGKVINFTVSDYGPSSPGSTLRQTNTSYMAFSGPNPSGYLAGNFLNLPYTDQVMDGSNVQQSLTTYGYDTKGNQTSVANWLNTGGSVSSQTVYDGSGMPIKTIDPNNNQTAYSYQCSDSLPYQLTNALGQVTTYSYNCSSGLLMGIKNPNDVMAGRAGIAFSYDAANSLISTTYPDQGSITYNYNNYSLPLTVTTTQAAAPNPSLVSSVMYDPLGRPTASTAPSGAVMTTLYDGDGRVSSVSNPHYAVGSLTDGTTTLLYDPLGRKTQQTQPDGAIQKWNYVGNATTFTDEAGNSWQQTTDAMGRLQSVIEPGGASTGYVYDTLDNLRMVNQNGVSGDIPRIRSFTYDSLSRLICASNPESSFAQCPPTASTPLPTGVVSYIYYANGNVKTKTDARGVAASFNYDALNRVVGKSYAGGNYVTPSACFQYDTISGTTVKNGIGNLVESWTQNGACPGANQGIPTASAITWKQVTGYDPMGRVLSEQQCAHGPCTVSNTSPLQYSYDLAGAQVYSTNGLSSSQSPQLGFTYSNDNGGRLNAIKSTWDDATHPVSLFTQAIYGPVGITSANLGVGSVNTTAVLAETRSYDNRERVSAATATATAISSTPTPIVTASLSVSPVPYGETPTVQVQVSCNTNCGTVRFTLDGSFLYTTTLRSDGTTFLNLSASLSMGTHLLLIAYQGNSNFLPASTTVSFSVVADNLPATTVQGALSNNPVFVGTSPTVITVLGCTSACGVVTYLMDGASWKQVSVNADGSVTAPAISTSLAAGTHTVTINYGGNSQFGPTSIPVPFTVVSTAPTSSTLSLDVSPVPQDEVPDMNNQLGCDSCGPVLFYLDGTLFQNTNVRTNGLADNELEANIPLGWHLLTAKFAGNATNPAASASIAFRVITDTLPVPTLNLSVTNSVTVGTAPTIVNSWSCTSKCDGWMNWSLDGELFQRYAIVASGYSASPPVPTTSAVGSHSITMNWGGNAIFAPASKTVNFTVVAAGK
jgi:YD repeat-containing protein